MSTPRCAECGMNRFEVERSAELMNSESGSGVPIEDPICCETIINEPDYDDSVKFCPDCEKPNQFGEQCQDCRDAEALYEETRIGGIRQR